MKHTLESSPAFGILAWAAICIGVASVSFMVYQLNHAFDALHADAASTNVVLQNSGSYVPPKPAQH